MLSFFNAVIFLLLQLERNDQKSFYSFIWTRTSGVSMGRTKRSNSKDLKMIPSLQPLLILRPKEGSINFAIHKCNQNASFWFSLQSHIWEGSWTNSFVTLLQQLVLVLVSKLFYWYGNLICLLYALLIIKPMLKDTYTFGVCSTDYESYTFLFWKQCYIRLPFRLPRAMAVYQDVVELAPETTQTQTYPCNNPLAPTIKAYQHTKIHIH